MIARHGDGAGAGSAATHASASGVRWNLRELYEDPADPALERDLAAARERAAAFVATWRGRIAAASASDLRCALEEYEALQELAQRPGFYASLLAAADTQDTVALALEQRTTEAHADLRTTLVFFELELIALDDARADALVVDPALADYAHFLTQLRRFRPHVLSEPEERILTRKDLGGRAAFVQLYDELTGAFRFRIRDEDLTEGEVLARLHHPERTERRSALAALLEPFAAAKVPLTAIMNAILLDHRIDCELRSHADVTHPTHLANEIAPEVVATMMAAVERHRPVIHRYLRRKAILLGLPRLGIADVYAPLDDAGPAIPWERGRTIVLEAFGRFDGGIAAIADTLLASGHVDAEIRPRKRSGAFCAALGPSQAPYVLSTYTETGRDVATLAHELGHAVHYALACRQRLLHYEPPLVLAETASVFAEMLVTDHLLATTADPSIRRRLLVETLDEMYGTVFRQHALTRFEIAAHAARRSRRLDHDQICELWMAEQRALFADSVDLDPAYRTGWSYIPHFIHSRFYCYSYAFGELLTLALFQRYKEEGARFVPAYLELLAAGGSATPEALASRLGFDLRAAAFWDGGCAAIAAMVDEIERS
ncbi:MAG: M3 family oligoendopeptidase [Deltaproteobacteria bacterium]|nr:M3 family oligoendopeptidase [Deltaproteobacteria bacterium]